MTERPKEVANVVMHEVASALALHGESFEVWEVNLRLSSEKEEGGGEPEVLREWAGDDNSPEVRSSCH